MDSATRFEKLLENRRSDPRFEEDIWRFLHQISGNLRNLTERELNDRWRNIAKNILHLVDSGRDFEPLSSKGFSSWWWFQTLVHTEAELASRGLPKPPVPDVASPAPLRPEFRPERVIAPRLWARIGEVRHLIRTLREGEIRFRPASSYADVKLNEARYDAELDKPRKRPGQALIMTRANGQRIKPIGDVSFSQRSTIEVNGTLKDVEYWISSWSLELDPRLFSEFSKGNAIACDACLVVWDTEAFGDRVDAAVHARLRGWRFADIAVRYFDPYDLQSDDALPASMEKDFVFGYQRELRLCLGSPMPVERGEPMFLTAGSLADIAGLYDVNGGKLAGAGPETYLANV